MVAVDGEIHADGVNGNNVGQLGGGTHQVTDGYIGVAYNAIVRGADDGVIQINLCLGHGGLLLAYLCLGCFHLCLGCAVGLLGIGQVFFRHRAGLHKLGIALHVQLRLGGSGFGSGE